jgi:zinc protease
MAPTISRALILALSLALGACASMREAVVPASPGSPAAQASEAAEPPAAAPTATGIAPLDYVTRTLPNGLRVYSIRDTSASNVSVQVWYDVGSKDDPRGRSGFAHMFEHLMFKSTRNLVPEQMDRLTEDVGGYNNASTADDYTNYYEVVPANHLQRLLWAEAERMGSLVVEPGFFASERDVVKEELRSSYFARPYGKMFLYYPQIAYDVHPYARPGIGNIEELDAATIDDVRAFHAIYYRPDNAVLVVAGNFDQGQLDAWIDQYFAPIQRPGTAIPRVSVAEPARSEARHYTVYEANTPLPAALITYPAPTASDRDAAVFEVIDAILSSGQSSRLYQSLIYRDQIASEASSFAELKQGPGTFVLFAIMAGGKEAAAGEAGLRAEVARLRDERVTDAELTEAKNELLTSALTGRETVDGKANELAEAIIVAGDAAAADRRLAALQAVTADDVQRVARAWLRDERSASLRYLPEEAKTAGARADTIRLASTVLTVPLATPANVPIIQPAPAAQRIAPPPVARELVAAIPRPDTQHLANGLTIITIERHELPLITASVVVGGGSTIDPRGKAGLGELTASLITQGTTSRSATQIAQAVEALGSSLQSGSGWDESSLSLTVKADQADPALAIMSDVVRNPAFAAEELERQRAIAIDNITVSMKDPGSLSGLVAARAVYGEAPYGHPESGTLRSLKAIGRDDILTAYRAAWSPANATLILAGDVDPARARALGEKYFGSWTGNGTRPQIAATAALPGPRIVVVDMPGAGQAAVAVARGAIARNDPRFYRALVANAVLGTGFSSRLNQEIRIKRGLAYGARSSIDARLAPGPFIASTQTKNPTAPEVLGLIIAEMRRLGAEPIPAAELTTRQAVLNGGFGRTIETTSGLAGLIATYVVRGVPPEEIARYQRSVSAVTPQEAQAAAAELLNPSAATMVIVGDASLFLTQLRRDHPDVVVIPLSALDLESPALR